MREGQTDFLDDMEPEPATTEPEPTQSEQSVARDDKGRFAPKAGQTDDQVQQGVNPGAQPAPEPEPPSGNEGPHVPRAALEAERKKRQQLEAELARFRQPQTPTAQQSQPNPTPKGPEFAPPQIDYDEDPQSYLQAHVHSMRMQQSHFFAAQQSSEQEVAEAWDAFDRACNTDPAISAYSETLINHPHPMGEVLKWHKKQKQLAELEAAGGLEALRERWIAEELARRSGQPAPAAQGYAQQRQTPKPATLPSLANGGGGQANAPELLDEDEDFNGFFEGARKPRKR